MRIFLRFFATFAFFTVSPLSLRAAPIVFFSTGVDENGFVLPDFTDDPHYTVTVAPPNGSTGAPNASASIPPEWNANGAFSRWIVPPGAPVSSDLEPFIFRQSFNISSPLVNESYILMRVSSDNFLQSVKVNDNETGIVYDGNFTLLSAQVAVQNGFVLGQNTIDFPVINATPNDNPVGLRVEVIDTYQPPANHAAITGLVNTGAAVHDGPSLPHGSDVPVWTLTSSPAGIIPIKVHTSAGAFPIPPWVSDNNSSAWIGPDDADINGLPGDYEYSIAFDLTGFDLDSVVIRGMWATDNGGIGIFLNGVDTGNLPSPSFTDMTLFSLSVDEGEIFNPGLNTLSFRFNNAGDVINPTGFRAEFLTATGIQIIPEPGSLLFLTATGLACMSRARFRAISQ
ncbi:MAG TPA: hypothetical protein VFV83_05365 [Chthoniobacteraceae bacterium]|nr:hypothetical protein [Chthoniobacteraceae bacterium]